jgi:hypothetical protein
MHSGVTWRWVDTTTPSFKTCIYLSCKVVCLLCLVLICTDEIHQTGMFQIVLLISFDEHGCIGLVSCHLDLWCRIFEYWMIFSMKIKLNCSWNFWRNWNVPLEFLERSWWAGFNGIFFVRFGFRTWEILTLKWFLPLKIQINSKKPF